MTRFRCTLLVVLFLVTVHCLWVRATNVQTRFGKIRGLWGRSTRGRLAAFYLGIPYALPPVGELRFKSPLPWNRTWSSTFNAIKDGPKCVQQSKSEGIVGSEDCLYLNIFVPIIEEKEDAPKKLPVMVFVHGGKFARGNNNSSKYIPDYLMDQNVVLVTINYRLNIMGFFSTENKVSPGNYGLKDIVMALRWLQENIDVFHGDPNSVTLWGHSAGAGAAHILAMNKKSEGLFHRYILHSGNFFSRWNVNGKGWLRRHSLTAAWIVECLPYKEITQYTLQCPKEPNSNETNKQIEENVCEEFYESFTEQEDEQILECMRAMPAEALVDTIQHFEIWRTNPCCPFGPIIEDESEDAVLTNDYNTVLQKRLFRDIPFIIGGVKDEGLIKSVEMLGEEEELFENLDRNLPLLTEFQQIVRNRSGFSNALAGYYFDYHDNEELRDEITMVSGDGANTHSVHQTLQYQLPAMKSAVYLFYFTYQGTFSQTFFWGTTVNYGVCHGDDINYLLASLTTQYGNATLQNNESDMTMVNIMTEMWAHFATTGVPTAWGVPAWPDYKINKEYLVFGVNNQPDVMVAKDFLPERMKLWDEVVKNFTTLEIYPVEAEASESDSGTSMSPNNVIIPLLILLAFVFRK